MTIAVVAVIDPIEGHESVVEGALRAAVGAVLARDRGCERYELHSDSASNRFIMIERWSDQAAIDAHEQGHPFTELVAALDGHLRAPISPLLLTPLGITS